MQCGIRDKTQWEKSQCRSLGENYMLLEKQLLVYYWALVKMEPRDTEWWYTQELLVLTRTCQNQVVTVVRPVAVHPKMEMYLQEQSRAEYTSKLNEQVAQTTCHHGCTHTPPSLWLFGGPVWSAEEGKAWTRFMDELAYYVGASWKWTAAALHAHSGLTLKGSFKKKNLQFFCKKGHPVYHC